jgi:hypothetical protein
MYYDLNYYSDNRVAVAMVVATGIIENNFNLIFNLFLNIMKG